jgi:hypothetical protein
MSVNELIGTEEGCLSLLGIDPERTNKIEK